MPPPVGRPKTAGKEQNYMEYITIDGKKQAIKDIKYVSKKTETIQGMSTWHREELQQEFIEESNSMNWDNDDEICILCGDVTFTTSRYCMSCQKVVISKYQRLIRKEFTPAEIQFLDEQVEFFGINADLNKED